MNTTAERASRASQRASSSVLAEVDAGVVGEQHDTVGVEVVERAHHFRH
jgi:hypothetical protein